MKLNGKILVAVAMMLGAMATTGCKSGERSAQQDGTATTAQPAQAPDQSAEPAKQDDGATVQASTKVSIKTQTQVPAPPPERVEFPGQAPSREHSWIKGFWRFDAPSFKYVWSPGHWMVQFAPSAPPAPRYENPGRPPSDRHVFVKGYWKWTGREWTWIGGHWDTMRGDSTYVAPHWDRENGRYHYVPGRWVRR